MLLTGNQCEAKLAADAILPVGPEKLSTIDLDQAVDDFAHRAGADLGELLGPG